MTATQVQLDELERFVENTPPAEGWKLTPEGGTALRSIKISDEINWILHLFPLSAGGWRAYCFGPDSERKFTGSLDECKTWLAFRERETNRLIYALGAVEELAGQRGWQVKHPKGATPYPYAQRTFAYPEIKDVDRVHMLMSVNGGVPPRSAPLSAAVVIAFSAGPQESITGDADEVRAWLKGWEKTLQIPGKLRECSDLEEAREIAARVLAADASRLAYLLEIGGSNAGSLDRTRRELVDTFVAARVRKAGGR